MFDERIMYVAALLIGWGTYCYLRDMHSSDTRPNLVTWFLWSLTPMIAFAAQIQAKVGPAALLTLMVGLCPLAVFVAGLRKGDFRPTYFDLLCGSASLAALGLWLLTGSGTLAVGLSILADGLAATPTLVKAYREPQSESPFLFLLFAISAALTLLTIDAWNLEAAGFSVYIFVLYVILFALVKTDFRNKLTQDLW